MLLSTLLSSLACFPLLALATPQSYRRLPMCSTIDRPCRCPRGTTFKNLTSFGIIGAPAIDVQDIMHDFLDLEWQGGLIPESTTGDGKVVGATRTFNFTGPAGPTYLTSEVLFRHESSPDGSFVQGIAQSPEPRIVQVPGAGTYYGQYGLIIAQQTVIANETAIAWKNWRCEIGETFPAALSHENGIANTSAILQRAGKRTGVDVTPFTIFYEIRNE